MRLLLWWLDIIMSGGYMVDLYLDFLLYITYKGVMSDYGLYL